MLRSIAIAEGCWALVLLYFISNPGVDYGHALLTVAGTMAALIGAVVFEVVAGRGPGRSRRWILWALVLCLAIGVLGVFVRSQSPMNPLFRLRFALSQRSLMREASAPSRPGPQWIGLFHVERVERFENEVRFITGMCGLVEQCGLVVRQTPPSKTRGKQRLTHLTGDWYQLYDVF